MNHFNTLKIKNFTSLIAEASNDAKNEIILSQILSVKEMITGPIETEENAEFFLEANSFFNAIYATQYNNEIYKSVYKQIQDSLLKHTKSKVTSDPVLNIISRYALSTSRHYTGVNLVSLFQYLAKSGVLAKGEPDRDGEFDLYITGLHAKVFSNCTHLNRSGREILSKADIIYPQAFAVTNAPKDTVDEFKLTEEYSLVKTLNSSNKIQLTHFGKRKGSAEPFKLSWDNASTELKNLGLL